MKYILAPLHNWMTCFEAGVTQSPREALLEKHQVYGRID